MSNVENLYSNSSCYCFEYPREIEAKTGVSGLTLPRRELYLMLARDLEKDDPKSAAFFREVANHYPDCDSCGYQIDRDGNRNILVDYDDWDELSDEERLLRGNRNSTIAILDRLRFHLEMMDDNVARKEEIDAIRRAINDLVEPLSMM
ncbi:hypothetical protein [Agrobacterium cavarae]|uniref:hypothetical protein n=1 Tax=Agrobacterium cavarae TaxID=2528239 RepID=UPI0028AA8AAB|nr:hypothetical protein [Agrobacterium cavarae]